MRVLGCFAVVLSACALPGQLQSAGSSLPAVGGAATSGAVPPVALGRGAGACGPERNHCIRPGTWFSVEDLLPGSGHPATPVFESDGKWMSYEDREEVSWGLLILRTEVAVPSKVKHGDPLVVWRPHDDEPLYPVSEEQAQTRSRWLVMIVDTVDSAAGTFKMQGGPDVAVPLAAARSVVERREIREKK